MMRSDESGDHWSLSRLIYLVTYQVLSRVKLSDRTSSCNFQFSWQVLKSSHNQCNIMYRTSYNVSHGMRQTDHLRYPKPKSRSASQVEIRPCTDDVDISSAALSRPLSTSDQFDAPLSTDGAQAYLNLARMGGGSGDR